MEPSSVTLRRYINLFEEAGRVAVTVESYVGVDQAPASGTPFVSYFEFEAMPGERHAITRAIRDEIETTTGYEPAKFSWKWLVPPKSDDQLYRRAP